MSSSQKYQHNGNNKRNQTNQSSQSSKRNQGQGYESKNDLRSKHDEGNFEVFETEYGVDIGPNGKQIQKSIRPVPTTRDRKNSTR